MEHAKVKVPIKVLQYPFAQLKTVPEQKMVVRYKTSKEEIIYTCEHHITVDDFTKLLVAIYCSTILSETMKDGYELIIARCSLKNIKAYTNLHDYNMIYESLKKFTSLKIQYNNIDRKITAGFVFAVERELSNNVTILFYKPFYQACQRGLTLDLKKYIQLSPTGKHLYGIITSFQSYNVFDEDFLISRLQIKTTARTKARQIIKKALQELIEFCLIKNFKKIKKGTKTFYALEKKSLHLYKKKEVKKDG